MISNYKAIDVDWFKTCFKKYSVIVYRVARDHTVVYNQTCFKVGKDCTESSVAFVNKYFWIVKGK